MSTPGPYPPPPPPSAAGPVGAVGRGGEKPTRTRRPVDITITIVLIIALALLGLLSLFFGLFFAMASDGCFDSERCYDRVATGLILIELAPVVAWVPTTVWAIVRMVRGKLAFWVPLLALPIWLGFVVWGFTFFPS